MKPEEKVQLFSDLAVIKEQVHVIHNELKPEIKRNSRFRIMIIGFTTIAVPLIALAARLL